LHHLDLVDHSQLNLIIHQLVLSLQKSFHFVQLDNLIQVSLIFWVLWFCHFLFLCRVNWSFSFYLMRLIKRTLIKLNIYVRKRVLADSIQLGLNSVQHLLSHQRWIILATNSVIILNSFSFSPFSEKLLLILALNLVSIRQRVLKHSLVKICFLLKNFCDVVFQFS
jgi:hypothetical protein